MGDEKGVFGRRMLGFWLLLLGLVIPAVADRVDPHDEVVQQDSRPIIVRYQNGTTERYVVKWTGTVNLHEWETGGPAVWSFGQVHPVDDRQCHWEFHSQIVRKLYFVNENGEQFAKEELTTVYAVPFSNKGSDFLLIGLRSENCNDAQGRFAGDVDNSRTRVMQSFTPVVENDLASLTTVIKKWNRVVDVTLAK